MTAGEKNTPYLVLARKYRPRNFSELIGQSALVTTLSNAIAMNRVAHAFMLTGVRGVGKTTTARILALAFNCIGEDGKGSMTAEPCGKCENCKAIIEGRHVDVLELDAASRTKVDDIREIIDSVQYAPTSARYKIYIIDEVHMLSKSAFNALLKTLEEPPAHVKFVFATTEINKVPITILSRCQRFDLQRIEQEKLSKYFSELIKKEKIEAEGEAIAMIARAADGSVRDGLSLLDRAISLSDGSITAKLVEDMLGLADKNILFDLFEALTSAKAGRAFEILDKLYKSGADSKNIIDELLNITHLITKFRAVPETLQNSYLTQIELDRSKTLQEKLEIPALTRLWQILLKGFDEVSASHNPKQTLDMVVIKALYAAELPVPQDIINKLNSDISNISDKQIVKKKL